jgi:hypothetical protein
LLSVRLLDTTASLTKNSTARHCLKPRMTVLSESESESYITTDGQSASLSWNKASIWGLRPDFYYCQTVAGLLMWGALSDERTGLSFTTAGGPRQHSSVGLVTIFYCLRFETSFFVASYNSQGYGGGTRPRLHTGSSLTSRIHCVL